MITTHVLDTAAGKPAAGVPVTLEIQSGEGWKPLGGSRTDSDGRVRDLKAAGEGVYRLTFDLAGVSSFFPVASIVFRVADASQHYHVPLLLSGHGYTTYRGS